MTKLNEIYKCNVCGNIVEMVHAGVGQLVCCGQPMELQAENTVDAAQEKHVPVLTREGDKVTINVGAVAHPMTAEHYIEWIELIADGKAYRQFLKPGEVATATFNITASSLTAREYCNLHGLWAA